MNREKVIKKTKDGIRTGYLDDDGNFILHSFDDEPAIIIFTNSGTKMWCEDNKIHRDNNLPAVIRSNGYNSYYKNEKRYWFINDEEYYDIDDVYKKFKNKILKLKNINMKILKDNGIVDAIWLYDYDYYLILEQSQYNLAILKFI